MKLFRQPMGVLLGAIIGLYVFEFILKFLGIVLDDLVIRILIFVIIVMMAIGYSHHITNRTFDFRVRPVFRFLIGCIGTLIVVIFFLVPQLHSFNESYSFILYFTTMSSACFLIAFCRNLRGIHFGILFFVICALNTTVCVFTFQTLNFSQKVFFGLSLVYIFNFLALIKQKRKTELR